MTLVSPDPSEAPRLQHRYLGAEADRTRLRAGVRFARELLRAAGLRPGGGDAGDPDAPDAPGDAALAARLTTSAHLCGSARMGPADDPGAVVGPDLRVHGVAGLRVVDTSVIGVPRRGPAATALMLGEWAARNPTNGR